MPTEDIDGCAPPFMSRSVDRQVADGVRRQSACCRDQRSHPRRVVLFNVADSTVLPDLLHGNETRVWGDQAYRGQRAVIRQQAPRTRDFVNRRYRHRGVVDEVERAKNRTKSKVRARVEHAIGVISRYSASPRCAIAGSKRTPIACS
jgi:hypothetical protein